MAIFNLSNDEWLNIDGISDYVLYDVMQIYDVSKDPLGELVYQKYHDRIHITYLDNTGKQQDKYYKWSELSSDDFPDTTFVLQHPTDAGNPMQEPLKTLLDGQLTNLIAIEDDSHHIATILDNCCKQCTNLKKISFPAVSSIGGYGFSSCSKLESINISSIQNIGGLTFDNSKKISKAYVNSDKLLSIWDDTVVVDRDRYEHNGGEVFVRFFVKNQEILSSDKIYEIPTYTLRTDALKKIWAPNLSINIDSTIFSTCNNLSSIYVDNIHYKSITDGSNQSDALNVIVSKDGTKFITAMDNVVILSNDNLTSFSAKGFQSTGNRLQKILIDNDVIDSVENGKMVLNKDHTKVIAVPKRYSAASDANLNDMLHKYNDVLTCYGEYAFNGVTYDSHFDGIISSDIVTRLEQFAFSGGGVLSCIFPNATYVGNQLFWGNPTVEYIYLPRITSIPSDFLAASNEFTGKDATIIIPNAETITNTAFENHTQQTYYCFPKAKTVGAKTFYHNLSLKDIMLSSCESLGQKAFNSCKSLLSISLPKCKAIESETFYQCESLSSVELPLVTSVGYRAFRQCYSLSSISLPECTDLKDQAFQMCTNLTSLSLSNINMVTTVQTTTFDGVENGISIYVPMNLVQNFENQTNWKMLKTYGKIGQFIGV